MYYIKDGSISAKKRELEEMIQLEMSLKYDIDILEKLCDDLSTIMVRRPFGGHLSEVYLNAIRHYSAATKERIELLGKIGELEYYLHHNTKLDLKEVEP